MPKGTGMRKVRWSVLLLLYLLYLGLTLEAVRTDSCAEPRVPEQVIYPLAFSYKAELVELLELLDSLHVDPQPALPDLFSGFSFFLVEQPPSFLPGSDLLYLFMSLQR